MLKNEMTIINDLKKKFINSQVTIIYQMIAEKPSSDQETILKIRDEIKRMIGENFDNGLLAMAAVGAEIGQELANA